MRNLTVDEIITEVAKFGNIAAENQKTLGHLQPSSLQRTQITSKHPYRLLEQVRT